MERSVIQLWERNKEIISYKTLEESRFELVQNIVFILRLVTPVTWHSKNVPHDNFRLITSRQLSMSSVKNPGTYWYFCATPECSSGNRNKGKYSYMHNVQFLANSQQGNKHNPLTQVLFPGSISLIVEIAGKINRCPLPY